MFDWRKLEVFLKLYETKSFSKTAKELFISQPTVTIHLKDLENYLGVRLFDRDTRNVIPTRAGKIVYEYGKEMLRLYKEMEKELWPYKEEEGGLVEIGGSTIPGQYILPRIIKMFKETYPKITVYLKVSDTQGVVEGILKGEFDLGVVGAKLKQAELFFEPCCDDEIVLIGPSYFGRDEIDLENLYELPLIKRESGSGTWKNVLQTLEERGINLSKLNIVGEMGSTEAVKAAVKEGLGLSFVSKRAIELEASLGIIKEVKIRNFQIIRKFYLVYFKNKKFSLATEKFLKFFKKILS
ncbi:MAG: LysR family transcriptional regulator [Caldimicrobium thiodismutans]|uniref:LysR family transcriptional regulator n=1 Tax=Caldimicrobium thiodismutans TaxID=1653476 RepID=A0A2N7PI95_9BACT|nr:MAG: LysR family transcriptional regulator [Caldimicrobium thiodismutans]